MKHECRYKPPFRGHRWCRVCGKQQYSVAKDTWRDAMSLRAFASKWLPAISGTDPVDMLRVDVAFPFEWNCWESWNLVYRVRFDYGDVLGRTTEGLGTRIDVMHGWQSQYHEDFCRIDYEAEQFYEKQTGRPYAIGDNTYDDMRRIIQS